MSVEQNKIEANLEKKTGQVNIEEIKVKNFTYFF